MYFRHFATALSAEWMEEKSYSELSFLLSSVVPLPASSPSAAVGHIPLDALEVLQGPEGGCVPRVGASRRLGGHPGKCAQLRRGRRRGGGPGEPSNEQQAPPSHVLNTHMNVDCRQLCCV